MLVGDCTDIRTEGDSSVVASAEMHSDKTKTDAAMGLAWVTPTGFVGLATDLFCGRTSENKACQACVPVFAIIPGKYSLMYDKGVAKLQVHLPNLNQATPPRTSLSCNLLHHMLLHSIIPLRRVYHHLPLSR